MLYLSPIWHSLLPALRPQFGYMQVANRTGVGEAIRMGYPWMLDNGAFSDTWNEAEWRAGLALWQPYAVTCIAAVCPDMVGDAAATLRRFEQYAGDMRSLGYPVAFVTQDGLTEAAVPWGAFDVLFVGGSTEHKLYQAWPFINEAKRRGVWVHVGRVNSARRIARFWQADSVDGTALTRDISEQRQRLLLRAAQEAGAKKRMGALL